MTEWWEITLVIMGAIITILTVWEKIESRHNKFREPTNSLDTRVSLIEQKMREYDERFSRDLERLDKIEESNKKIQRGVLALLNHALTGNNEEEMQAAQKDLNNFVWGGKTHEL